MKIILLVLVILPGWQYQFIIRIIYFPIMCMRYFSHIPQYRQNGHETKDNKPWWQRMLLVNIGLIAVNIDNLDSVIYEVTDDGGPDTTAIPV